jgi:isopentenyl-diphosphate delta-isomerase type 1
MFAEYLDIVDEEDNVIGCEKRNLIHRLGLLHRGIHIFLFTADGKLLVQRRHRNLETWPLALDCSVSEHVKSGESYQIAAMRGLSEELGITSTELQPVIKFRFKYGETDNMISQLYKGNIESDIVQMNFIELENIYYFNPNLLLQMIDQDEDTFSRWSRQLLLWYSGRPSDLEIITNYDNLNSQ